MKKNVFFISALVVLLFCNHHATAQQIKVGVFDIDLMVQAMPYYQQVDSLVHIYERDSLAPEYEIYKSEYLRLDKTFKIDSLDGKKSKQLLNYEAEQRQKMAFTLTYWQQIAQNKSALKRNELARPLYEQVSLAYQKILDKKKYAIVLKPQTYEFGFHIENIFISVAKELKLKGLPQEILVLGEDPDANTTIPSAQSKILKSKTN